jgi:hypothetical protein
MKTTLTTLLFLAPLLCAPVSCYPASSSAAPAAPYNPAPTAAPPPYLDPSPPPNITKVPSYTFKQLHKVTTNFLDQMMYPKNIAQAKSIKSTLFSENVIGRIEQVRSFHGREESTEWMFNLFANNIIHPDIQALFGDPLSYDVIKFPANENVVAADIIIKLNVTSIGITTQLQTIAFFTFEGAGAISEWDATFRYLERNFQYLFVDAGKLMGTDVTGTGNYVTKQLADSICNVESHYCTGSLKQFQSISECTEFMTNLNFGAADILGYNSLICRMMHQTLVPSRPQRYCPAIGPSGCNFCTNELELEYLQTVTDPLFINYPFVPYGYASKDAAIAAE